MWTHESIGNSEHCFHRIEKSCRRISELLKQEAFQAFEERKDFAKKLGEEAGTKMLAPIFLMLWSCVFIIVVPAFFFRTDLKGCCAGKGGRWREASEKNTENEYG